MTGFGAPRVAPEKADFRPALALPFSLPGSIGRTMTQMTYGDQLKHPNWQRKRLQMLEAAEWRCSRCHCAEVTLHVHHKHYVKGRMAWEYSAEELCVLCEDCHEEEHGLKDRRQSFIARLAFDGPLDAERLIAIAAGAAGEWVAGEELRALLAQYETDYPTDFWRGRAARELLGSQRWIGDDGLRVLAQLAEHNDAFRNEFCALLTKHAVPLQRWDF